MKLPIVVVTWTDAHTEHGWADDDAIEAKGATVYTVGFLVKSSPTAIVVASTSDREGANNARITIPRKMITSLVRLRVDSVKDANAHPPTDSRAAASSS